MGINYEVDLTVKNPNSLKRNEGQNFLLKKSIQINYISPSFVNLNNGTISY